MRSTALLASFFLWLSLGAVAAQDRPSSDAELRRLAATTENLLETQAAMQRRINALSDRCRALEQKLERSKGDSVSRSELKTMLDRLAQQFDKNRQEDKKLIVNAVAEIRKLAKLPPAPADSKPANSPRRGKKKPARSNPAPTASPTERNSER